MCILKQLYGRPINSIADSHERLCRRVIKFQSISGVATCTAWGFNEHVAVQPLHTGNTPCTGLPLQLPFRCPVCCGFVDFVGPHPLNRSVNSLLQTATTRPPRNPLPQAAPAHFTTVDQVSSILGEALSALLGACAVRDGGVLGEVLVSVFLSCCREFSLGFNPSSLAFIMVTMRLVNLALRFPPELASPTCTPGAVEANSGLLHNISTLKEFQNPAIPHSPIGVPLSNY
ncbi:hypothetical protein ACJJTC_005594 [Scirpophaga incertulas]